MPAHDPALLDRRRLRRRTLLDNDGYRFTRAIVHGRPYFGQRLASAQGDSRRHVWMSAVVAALAHERRDAINILELGSWAGGSTITWARALQSSAVDGRIFCVDHWRQRFDLHVNTALVYHEMVRATREGVIAGLFRHNVAAAGVADRIVVLESDTAPLLPMLGGQRFDIVFIDASHLYRDVLTDVRGAIPLVSEHGILCGDDLELQAGQCDRDTLGKAIQQDADFVTDPLTGHSYHPGVTAAVAEAIGPVPVWNGFWAVQRSGDRWEWPAVTEPAPDGHAEHLGDGATEPLRVDVRFVGDYAVYDAEDGAIALRHDVAPEDLVRMPRDVWERSELVLVATDLSAMETRIGEIAAARVPPEVAKAEPGAPPTPDATDAPSLVQENYFGFNIVRFGGRFYAVAQQIGPIDVATADISSLQDDRLVLVALSARDAILMVDGLRVTRKRAGFSGIVSNMAEARRGAALSEAPLSTPQQTLHDREHRDIARRNDELEAALAHSSASLANVTARLDDAERRVEELIAQSHQAEDRRVEDDRRMTALSEELTAIVAARDRDLSDLREQLRVNEAERAELSKWIEELHQRLASAPGGRRRTMGLFGW